jgi:isoleucyl-tRNA synthetase
MVFTAEEVWISRFDHPESSVHVMPFAKPLAEWKNDDLAAKWQKIRNVRSAVTGALEIARVNKTIGSSLEAAPKVYLDKLNPVSTALSNEDFAEVCITSSIEVIYSPPPVDAFHFESERRISVVVKKAEGVKCARSWKISKEIGSDKDFPDITPRDAAAVREWMHRFGKTV